MPVGFKLSPSAGSLRHAGAGSGTALCALARRDTRSTRAISCLLTPSPLQFQNRAPLRLAQPVSFPVPFRFLPPSGSVPGARFRSLRCACSPRLLPAFISGNASLKSAAGAAYTMASAIYQIPLDLFDRFRHRCCRLPLRFQKRCRFSENALANRARTFAPRGVKLRGLPCIRNSASRRRRLTMRSQPSALTRAISTRYFHRDLRSKIPIAHLPLDRFRQQLDQPQSPRYPAHAAVEAARQFSERVNRNAAPSPKAASPVRERFPAGSVATTATAAELRLRPSTGAVASAVSPRSGSSAAMRL